MTQSEQQWWSDEIDKLTNGFTHNGIHVSGLGYYSIIRKIPATPYEMTSNDVVKWFEDLYNTIEYPEPKSKPDDITMLDLTPRVGISMYLFDNPIVRKQLMQDNLTKWIKERDERLGKTPLIIPPLV